jgi:hypothetical protein
MNYSFSQFFSVEHNQHAHVIDSALGIKTDRTGLWDRGGLLRRGKIQVPFLGRLFLWP